MFSLVFVSILLTGTESSDSFDQKRLALTGNPGEMQVLWVTQDVGKPELHYAPAEGAVWTKVRGTQKMFQAGPGNTEYINTAVMTGLKEGMSYKYYVGDFPFFSEHVVFKAYTPYNYNNTEHSDLTFAVLSDWGVGIDGDKTYKSINNFATDLAGVLHYGGIAYTLEDDDGYYGDYFLRNIDPLVRTMPYMVVPGEPDTFRNFSQVINRFNMPKNSNNKGTGLFYSFNMGYAHYVMLNTAYYMMDKTEYQIKQQLDFLKNDLAEANKYRNTSTPWIIVLGHQPLYCTDFENPICVQYAQKLQEDFEEIFHENSVDVYVSGHIHFYERNSAIYKNKTVASGSETEHSIHNAGATVYITSGIAGSREGKNAIPPNLANWCKNISDEVGYGLITVKNESYFLWHQIQSDSNSLVDFFVMTKNTTRPF